jgi:TonB family protein
LTTNAYGIARGRNFRLRCASIFMVCGAATLLALPGFAQEPPAQESPTNFDIPIQPLATALEAFSAASHYQILMAETELATIRSNAVKGSMPPREALARMISGTGLEARVTAARAAIVVRDVHSASMVVATRKDVAYYNAVLQNVVMVALCRDAATHPGSYRAALDLWVTSAGRIERATLLNSTGDPARDNRIVAALRALDAGPPPPSLAQPTTLLVLPGGEARQSCETALASRGTPVR